MIKLTGVWNSKTKAGEFLFFASSGESGVVEVRAKLNSDLLEAAALAANPPGLANSEGRQENSDRGPGLRLTPPRVVLGSRFQLPARPTLGPNGGRFCLPNSRQNDSKKDARQCSPN